MIELKNIDVTFESNQKTIHAVQNVSLAINKGEVYGIVGYSGAGKSTLVRVMNLLQRPTSGEVWVNQEALTELSDKGLRQARKKIGMIFQHFNLLPSRTVLENVLYPLKNSSLSRSEKITKAQELLTLVGLQDHLTQYPSQLSGGQKQRVAIARALANDPDVLLCDEATSALDPKTTQDILALLKKLNEELELTIVLITHEMQVVKDICDRVAVMQDGRVIEQGPILQIFTQPQEALTVDFVQTANHFAKQIETIDEHPSMVNVQSPDQLVHLSYVGSQTNQPLIASLYERFHVKANILYGDIDVIQKTLVGNLLVVLTGEPDAIEKSKTYLTEEGVFVTRIDYQTKGGKK
ncbi:ATP-binding cassette domain-containing protein [Vagococcus lutrae]|uniref:methionine ABC transporter ATP-binding protein n=1 Tax=Vagococcus lutrae TaxID=81947 RepID=UPI002A823409|nr:ATP-binding cassette domain-containing protein [Vagococcus lutrae]MDY3706842.1 ATP-binding cassette domain-containing protein [Vagococcus lutrae]